MRNRNIRIPKINLYFLLFMGLFLGFVLSPIKAFSAARSEGSKVVYKGKEIFTIKASMSGQSASQRAKLVNAVLERLDLSKYKSADIFVKPKGTTSDIMIKDRILLAVGAEDAKADGGSDAKQLAQKWVSGIQRALFGLLDNLPSDPYDFMETTSKNGIPVVLSFYSRTCYWCRKIREEFKSLIPKYDDKIGFLFVDIDDPYNDELVYAFDAYSVPWNVFVGRDGNVSSVIPGYADRSELEKMIKPILSSKSNKK